jgi:hypothetical protein
MRLVELIPRSQFEKVEERMANSDLGVTVNRYGGSVNHFGILTGQE